MSRESDAAVIPLCRALRDEDQDVPSAAAQGLEQMGKYAATAVPALIEALDDDRPGVRWAAIETLGRIGASGFISRTGAGRTA